jgi:hypothetical protein
MVGTAGWKGLTLDRNTEEAMVRNWAVVLLHQQQQEQ